MKNLIAFVLTWLVAGAALAQALPPLNFDSPPGFSGGGDEVATFSTPERDLVIHIYPFRRLGVGDFQARFRETLLREFVSPALRETKPAAAPQIQAVNVEGAEAALMGKFTDEQRTRNRLAMLSSGAVAVIDFTATSGAALERHAAAVKELLDSLSVGQPKARAAPPPVLATPEIGATVAAAAPAAAAAKPEAVAPAPLPAFLPGMYVGNVRRLIPSFVGGKESGGMWVTGPQYFLLSGDGLAYRNYEQPRLPGGDASRFDWKRAQVNDAANTGTYEVSGGQLTLRLGNETISAKLAGPGRFEIFGNYFKRAGSQ
jgi:hypothetical protein